MIADNIQSPSSSAHSTQIPDHAPSPLKVVGTFLGRLLIDHLKPLEPTVNTKRDRHGNIYWHIYDPNTNQTNIFTSEQDARTYLEKRHHGIPE